MSDDTADFVWHDPLLISDEQCAVMADVMNQAVQEAFGIISIITGIPALPDPLGPNYLTPNDAREFWERGVQLGLETVT